MPKRVRQIYLGILSGLLGCIFFGTPQGWELEKEKGLNWLFQLRGAVAPPDEVAVVAIDLESTSQLGLPVLPNFWPWPRDIHARLIDQLAQAGADIIVLDLIFLSEKEPGHDRQLAEAIRNAGNVIIVERLRHNIISEPQPDESAGNSDTYKNCAEFNLDCEQSVPIIPEIASAALAQAPFPLPKESLLHTFWAFKPGMGDAPTLPVVVFQTYTLPVYNDFIALLQQVQAFNIELLPQLRDQISDIEAVIFSLRQFFASHPDIKESLLEKLRTSQLDQRKKQMIQALISLYSGENMHYLNFYGPSRSIHTIPAYQILQSDKTAQDVAQTALSTVAGKVVFVGLSAATHAEIDQIRDAFPTVLTNSEKLDISGVEIAATAFANLLENKPIKPLPYTSSLVILFVMGLALGIILPTLSRLNLIITGTIFAVGYFALTWLAFTLTGFWLPLVTPLFVVIPCAMVGAIILIYKQERDQLLALFGPYSPERVIGDMTRHVDASMLKNRNGFAACLSTDIEGYATLTERMGPEQIRLLVDNYFSILYQCVRQNNGIVNERVGDAMLAVWEVTDDQETVRRQVCEAGLAIKNSVSRLNSESNYPALPTRIGIHFGELLISRLRFRYRQKTHFSRLRQSCQHH